MDELVLAEKAGVIICNLISLAFISESIGVETGATEKFECFCFYSFTLT